MMLKFPKLPKKTHCQQLCNSSLMKRHERILQTDLGENIGIIYKLSYAKMNRLFCISWKDITFIVKIMNGVQQIRK